MQRPPMRTLRPAMPKVFRLAVTPTPWQGFRIQRRGHAEEFQYVAQKIHAVLLVDASAKLPLHTTSCLCGAGLQVRVPRASNGCRCHFPMVIGHSLERAHPPTSRSATTLLERTSFHRNFGHRGCAIARLRNLIGECPDTPTHGTRRMAGGRARGHGKHNHLGPVRGMSALPANGRRVFLTGCPVQ